MKNERFSRRTVLGSVGAVTVSPGLVARTGTSEVPEPLQFFAAGPEAKLCFAATLRVASARNVPLETTCQRLPIIDGEIAGPGLQGVVQAGQMEWRAAADGQGGETALWLTVRCADGTQRELRDRGTYQSGRSPVTAVIASAPELLDPLDDLLPRPSLLVGRLDASGLADGVVRLVAYEVG